MFSISFGNPFLNIIFLAFFRNEIYNLKKANMFSNIEKDTEDITIKEENSVQQR
jgi:hypothetical protein